LDDNTQSPIMQKDDKSEEADASVRSVTLSKDGSRLMSMTGHLTVGTCRIWDTSTGKCLQTLRKMDRITTLSSDWQWLAAVKFGSPSVQMWGLTAMICIQILEHDSPVRCLAFSNDSQRLAVRTADLELKIWHVRQGICLQILVDHFIPYHDSIELVSFSPDGQRLAIINQDHIRIWDLGNGRCLRRYKPDDIRDSHFLGWSADAQQVVVGSRKTISLLPINKNYPGARVDHKGFYPESVAMTADRRWIAVATYKSLAVWNVETGQCAWDSEASLEISNLSFDPTCSSRLFTNTGVIEFELPSTSTHNDSNAEPLRLHRIGYGISFDGQWIMRGDERMLKLPVEYRGTSVDVTRTKDGLEHVIAIGCKTGRMIFMRFK